MAKRKAAVLVLASLASLYVYIVYMCIIFSAEDFYAKQRSRKQIIDQSQFFGPSAVPTSFVVTSSIPQVDTDPNLRQAVLLLSSVGRSGSTFVGQVLASQGSNIYFYEPIRALSRIQWRSRDAVQEELRRTMHCEIREEMLRTHRDPYVSVAHPYILGKNQSQVSMSTLKERCLQEPLRIIKTIRTRLAWVLDLLQDPELKLKVIHLARDPRGTIMSMESVQWKHPVKNTCMDILQDVALRSEMSRIFPDQYYFIRYEDFCRDPYNRTRDLLRFIDKKSEQVETMMDEYGQGNKEQQERNDSKQEKIDEKQAKKDAKLKKNEDEQQNEEQQQNQEEQENTNNYETLPKSVQTYLNHHTHVNAFSKKGPWSTVRDSSAVYQLWRKKITQKELSLVETECKDAIQRLGFRLFGNVSMARDMKVSLFDEGKMFFTSNYTSPGST